MVIGLMRCLEGLGSLVRREWKLKGLVEAYGSFGGLSVFRFKFSLKTLSV